MTTGQRFSQFLENIRLTDNQKAAGAASRGSVVSTLNWAYYSSTHTTSNSQYVGSWGKRTRVRPPRDVDVLYTLPNSVYYRYQSRAGNKQSQILQEVKSHLVAQYPYTNIRGSGPVVIVPFAAYNVELIPAFLLDDGQYYICMTDNGGHYKKAAYTAEASAMTTSNDASSGNTRDLIRMMKRWQAYCNVPLKSFHIELTCIDFLNTWRYRGKSSSWYDYMVRDYLEYLVGRKDCYVYAPGTYEMMSLGSAWEPKAKLALSNAKNACSYEASSSWALAGDEWQKLFGTDIPRNP